MPMPRSKRTLESIDRLKKELNIFQEDTQLRDLIASNRSKKYNLNDNFPVKKIRAHEWRIAEDKTLTLYYLVQWDGIYATPRFDSWEPSYNLHPKKLAEYHAQQNINPVQLERTVRQLLATERKLLREQKMKERLREERRKVEEEFHKGVAEMDVEGQNYVCSESPK